MAVVVAAGRTETRRVRRVRLDVGSLGEVEVVEARGKVSSFRMALVVERAESKSKIVARAAATASRSDQRSGCMTWWSISRSTANAAPVCGGDVMERLQASRRGWARLPRQC